MEYARRYKLGNQIVRVLRDDDPEHPRSMDGIYLGTFWTWERRYHSPDKNPTISPRDFSGWEELDAHITKELGGLVVLPVYKFEHSGSRYQTTPFSCPWDSGRVGVIFCTLESAAMCGIEPTNTEALREILVAEVETFDLWQSGNVWGFQSFESEEDEEKQESDDSCWGFYGDDDIESGLLEQAFGEGYREAVRCD